MKRLMLSVLCLLILAGCGGYWQITDPVSKNVYYTEEVEQMKGGTGAVTFTDAKTGKKVTLQNSEVMEVSKDQFKAGVGPK